MGGGPRHPSVTPRLGPQGLGAPGRFAPGAALGGVGEEQHHHPDGGPGHHRPADGGLKGFRVEQGIFFSEKGLTLVTTFGIGHGLPAPLECGKPRKGGKK